MLAAEIIRALLDSFCPISHIYVSNWSDIFSEGDTIVISSPARRGLPSHVSAVSPKIDHAS